ncbi:MAG: LysM domain-containing protein [Chloroflexi bacterium]|nr:LysM domain-containing protein [Chloroflexota bacterium]
MRQLCFTLICFAALMTVHAQQTDDLIHTVEAGETLISIANAYGVSLDQLLTLNNLDPDAYLQIGQRLLVIPDAVQTDGEEEAGEPASEEETSATISTAGHPEAPVLQASAPMMDPADLSPQICFIIFADENHNGMREPDEIRLGGGEIILFDAADVEQLHYSTDGESEPYCLRDLGRRLYRLEATAPDGYGLSDAASLWLDLRYGGKLNLEFGARQGFPTIARSALEANAEIENVPSDESRRLLHEVSGLVAVAIAGVVLISGLIAAVFLRGR